MPISKVKNITTQPHNDLKRGGEAPPPLLTRPQSNPNYFPNEPRSPLTFTCSVRPFTERKLAYGLGHHLRQSHVRVGDDGAKVVGEPPQSRYIALQRYQTHYPDEKRARDPQKQDTWLRMVFSYLLQGYHPFSRALPKRILAGISAD